MRLQIRGVPRNVEHSFTIEPDQSGALLGRMEGEKVVGLAIPIPHIEQPSNGEPTTICWSRKHLRFDFQGGAWYVTLLGTQKTLLDERELPTGTPQRLPPGGRLRCGDLTLQTSVEDNPFATRAIGPGARPPTNGSPWDTIAIRPDARPIVPDTMQRISVDNLSSQIKTMVEQMIAELDRITSAAQELQQRRSQAEQARDEARTAVAGVKQAASLTQLQAAVERVRDTAQRSRQANERIGSGAETVRRSIDRARDIERALKTLSADTALAASRLSPHDPTGRILSSQTAHSEDEARRRMAEIDEQGQRAAREREQAQTALRTAQEAEEEAMTLASRRESEFQRDDRIVAYAKRYSIIGLVLVSAILLGWLIGKLLEGSSGDPLGEGHTLLNIEPQQRLQIVQVADHALQVAVHLDVYRRIDQKLADEGQALERVEEFSLATRPVDVRALRQLHVLCL